MFNAPHRRSSRIICRTIATISLATALSLAASASPPTPRQGPETSSTTVSLSDLDLTTPQGVRETRARLARVAQQLCGRWADSRKVDDSASYAACAQETLANALRHLPTAALNARN